MIYYRAFAALALCVVIFTAGHHVGGLTQKAADQAQFDRINGEIAAQKAEANAAYRKAQDANVALLTARDKFKNDLEKQHAQSQADTASIFSTYSGVGLRYAGQSAGSGAAGGSTASASGNPSGVDPTADVQLPDAIARDLRQLALEADQLRDDYSLCYRYATESK